MAVTKHNVAEMAGVSHMTVSRVLNGSENVSQPTRERVLKACKALNYRKNIIASTLKSNRSYAIGVVIPSFHHTYFSRMLRRFEEKCRIYGYHVIVIQGLRRDDKPYLEWSDFEFLLSRKVDGLVINFPCNEEIISNIRQENIPAVFIDQVDCGGNFSFVGTDDFMGSKELTQYFISQGHSKIAYIAGTAGMHTAEQRLKGYYSALEEAGITIRPEFVENSNFNLADGKAAMEKLLAKNLDFTAVIGANDYVAIGALAAIHDHGLTVPDDISIAGFAGDEITQYTTPELTTMFQAVGEVGVRAFELLLQHIEDPDKSPEKVLLRTKLIERASVRSLK